MKDKHKFLVEASARYLMEYEDEKEILQDAKDMVQEILDNYYQNIREDEPQLAKNIVSLFARMIEFRNINNGRRFFDEEIVNVIPDDNAEVLKQLGSLANWVQRQATHLDPDWYV